MLFIKERIAELRKADPKLTFREAGNKVQAGASGLDGERGGARCLGGRSTRSFFA